MLLICFFLVTFLSHFFEKIFKVSFIIIPLNYKDVTMQRVPHYSQVLGREAEILPDVINSRERYLAVPQKIIQSLSTPHQKIDDLYLTRRVRGLLGEVEDTISSLLRYDNTRKTADSRLPIYFGRGNSDIASQLGVQPHTILPSPKTYRATPSGGYGISPDKEPYSSGRWRLEYFV